jgi:hypothetical protein
MNLSGSLRRVNGQAPAPRKCDERWEASKLRGQARGLPRSRSGQVRRAPIRNFDMPDGALSSGFEGRRRRDMRVTVRDRHDQPERPELRFMPLRQQAAAERAFFLTGTALHGNGLRHFVRRSASGACNA